VTGVPPGELPGPGAGSGQGLVPGEGPGPGPGSSASEPAAVRGPRLVLIGPMGAGKTTIGREVARRLGVPFADLDELIVEAAGRSIPEIFAAQGEQAFRNLEAQVLALALEAHAGVLALGGGAVVAEGSRALVAAQPAVLLEIDEETARSRVGTGRSRPMLGGEDPLGRWRTITAERMPLYREAARWIIDATDGGIESIARRIIDTLEGAEAPASKEDA
jgi:shikimate kinase